MARRHVWAGMAVVGAVATSLAAPAAWAETVTSHELQRDYRGYLCFLDMQTAEGPEITIQLSDYEDVWSLNVFVDDRASRYSGFFDARGFSDDEAFDQAFPSMSIGERTFDIDETWFPALRMDDIDAEFAASFEVQERHNVASALGAMEADGLTIPGLIAVTGTVGAFGEFRACAYDAMGLAEGERVEMDYRAEYRMLFDDPFDAWITHMATAEACGAARGGDAEVEEVIERAAQAFYPGLFARGQRGEYRDRLDGRVPLLRLTGLNEARDRGCLGASTLVNMARTTVDRAIELAEDVD